MLKPFTTLLFNLFIFASLFAQNDLMNLLENETKQIEAEATNYTTATFKTTRIINTQSVETVHKGIFQFIIMHRFGRLNSGIRELFGLDNANIRFGLEYGVNDWLTLGFGRSRNEKLYDGFVKARLLRQSSGKKKFPFTLVVFSSIGINTLKAIPERKSEMDFVKRTNYAHQILIARKFKDLFSIQIMPTWIHRNLVPMKEDDNDVFSLGAGTAVKITKSMRLTAEYHYVISDNTADKFFNPLSLGIDLETGGHVFQIMFTNSIDMVDNLIIPKTTGKWGDGDINFGFNVNRVFTMIDYEKMQKKKLKRKEQKSTE